MTPLIVNVLGVECVKVSEQASMTKLQRLSVDLGSHHSVCGLCPIHTRYMSNACTCDGAWYVDAKHLPLLRMRSIPVKPNN